MLEAAHVDVLKMRYLWLRTKPGCINVVDRYYCPIAAVSKFRKLRFYRDAVRGEWAAVNL